MEPLFFKAENGDESPLSGRTGWKNLLQWSRFFSKRKIKPFRRVLPTGMSFNGAAFFQSGKCTPNLSRLATANRASMEPLFFKAENMASAQSHGWTGNISFNGAAFFQSGKYSRRF